MLKTRFDAIAEEIAEVESLPELKALWCFGQVEGNEYAGAECVGMFKVAVARLKQLYVKCAACGKQHKIFSKCEKEEPVEDLQEKLTQLLKELEELKGPAVERIAPTMRIGKKYKLLRLEVAWSTKPQVHAIARILGAHAKVGDVLDETDIVRMMVANEGVLRTRQGGKRIWDYYKGDHNEGLTAHGNIEKV